MLEQAIFLRGLSTEWDKNILPAEIPQKYKPIAGRQLCGMPHNRCANDRTMFVACGRTMIGALATIFMRNMMPWPEIQLTHAEHKFAFVFP
jgi:hypothetical protein